jgi:photosystem II stability/assembly factor-like uncharacterized protein
MKKILTFILFILASQVVVAQWAQCKGPYGGSIRCVALSGQSIFAGLQSGGIYRSTDNGDTWVAVNNGISYQDDTRAVTSIVTSKNSIFIDTYYALYRSTDNGANWQEISKELPLTGTTTSMLVASDTLFVGMSGGLFRSIDNGDTWNKINNENYHLLSAHGSTIFASTNEGSMLVRSTDGGTTWIKTGSGLSATRITCLVVENSLVFAATDKGLFKSIDNGTTWATLPELENMFTNPNIYSLAIDGTTVFAGTGSNGIIRSLDNGDHWSKTTTGLHHTEPTSANYNLVMALAYDGVSLFAGHLEAGMYRSMNNGDTWKEVNTGIAANRITKLGVYATSLFGISQVEGIERSDDKGDSWIPAINGMLYPSGTTTFIAMKDTLFVWSGSDLYASTDTGNTWEVVNENLNGVSVYSTVPCGTMLFAGTSNGVYRSQGFGSPWEHSNNTNNSTYFLAVQDTCLYALTSGGLFRSCDYGTTWIKVNNNLPNKEIQILVATANGLFVTLKEFGIYRSTDNGDSWTAVSNGLQDKKIVSLITSGEILFAGSASGGVYRSNDNGNTWSAKNTTLITTPIVSMAVSETSLYVCSSSEGLFRGLISDFVTDVEEQPASPSSSLRVSPMPISGDYLTISNIPASASELHIYSLLGEIVHSEALNGAERRQMNVSGLPAGVYYLRVGMETRMVIKQ